MAHGVSNARQFIVFVIGIAGLGTLRRNRFDQISHHVILMLGNQPVGILFLRHPSQCVITVFLRIPLRRHHGNETRKLIIAVAGRSAVAICEGNHPVNLIVDKCLLHPIRIGGRQQIAFGIVLELGGRPQRIDLAGQAVNRIIGIGIDSLPRLCRLYQIAHRAVQRVICIGSRRPVCSGH